MSSLFWKSKENNFCKDILALLQRQNRCDEYRLHISVTRKDSGRPEKAKLNTISLIFSLKLQSSTSFVSHANYQLGITHDSACPAAIPLYVLRSLLSLSYISMPNSIQNQFSLSLSLRVFLLFSTHDLFHSCSY